MREPDIDEGKKKSESGARLSKNCQRNPRDGTSASSSSFPQMSKKSPSMADMLSFNWKRSVHVGRVFFLLTENSFSLNFASPPSLQTRSQIFLTGSEEHRRAQRASQDVRSPQLGAVDGGPTCSSGVGWSSCHRRRPALDRTSGHRPPSDTFARLRAWFPAAEACFTAVPPARLSSGAGLPAHYWWATGCRAGGRIIQKAQSGWPDLMLLERAPRRSSYSLSFLFVFLSARPRFARTSWPFGTTTHLKLFRFLFVQAPPPASCGHDYRPAGLPGVEARWAAAWLRWVDFRLGWGEMGYFLPSRDTPRKSHGVTAV